MTRFEKHLYNEWLHCIRKAQNKPFNARKTFDNVTHKDQLAVHRVASMLNRYPHIKAKQYFEAPFKIYKDETYYSLPFYASMKGIKALRLYVQHLQEESPDSDFHIQQISESLKFIARFCSNNNIKLNEYIQFKPGLTYPWMKHVKHRKISIYSLMEFSETYDIIMGIPEDEREILLGTSGKYFLGYKTKYLRSETARTLVSEGLKRIEKYIDK